MTPQGTISYGFNTATGQLANMSTGFTFTTYGYNTMGQLTSVSVQTRTTLTGSWTSRGTTSYTYDGDGNKLTETLPNGVVTAYKYDDLDRLIGMTTTNASGTTLFGETFLLNPDGTRASATETQVQVDGSMTTMVYTWGYDADQRLTGESLTATSSLTADTTTVATMDYSDMYTFDLDGNRLTEVTTGTGDGTAGTTTYVYNGDDQLMSSTSTATGVTALTYDPDGSQLTSTTGGVTTTYTYDVRNKMVGYHSGSTTATYVYDDAGNRVRETVNGTTTYYLTDIQNPTGYAQPVEQRSLNTAAPSVTYMIGDRVFGQVASGTTSFLLTDGHGSTIASAGVGGNVTASYAYSAYGDALNFTPAAAATVFLFGGDAVYDPISELYLHGDGTRARDDFVFLQSDEEGFGEVNDPLTLGLYLYAGSDAVNRSDLTGHDWIFEESEQIELAIGIRYKATHFGNAVSLGAQTRLGANPQLKPDIFDKTDKVWMDVKPLSPSGIRDAIATHAKYSANFAPLGYTPCATWVPLPQPMQVLGYPIYVFNFNGILFYTSFSVRDLLAIPLLLQSNLGEGAAVGNEIVRLQEIAADSVKLFQPTVTSLSQEGAAEIESAEGVATLDSLEGAP